MSRITDCGIDAVEKRQRLFLFQPNIGDSGHSTEAHIGVKNFSQFVAFTVLIKYLLAESTESTLRFANLKTVKIEELTERERQHFDFDAPPRRDRLNTPRKEDRHSTR